jgi:hypothetical protein
MGVGRGDTTIPCKKENCGEASKKFSRILWKRPRPKLGCGAKERKKSFICSSHVSLADHMSHLSHHEYSSKQ